MDKRIRNAKLNILSSLALQVVTVICGLLVPRLLLQAFRSEIYGATTSITQFLSYIALLEGGIGGVARSALYKPLAEGDNRALSAVVNEIKRFFFTVGCVFLLYVLILSVSFKSIARIEVLDWLSTVLLVWAISFSSFLQYFIGLPYGLLLQADQKNYISAFFSIISTIANAVLVYYLVNQNCSIIVIKYVSSLVFATKPILQNLYVKSHYQLVKTERASNVLTQKWTGLGQHLAYFVHTNTDVVVLTLFADLKTVAVYGIYHMVIANIQNLTAAFSSGMEALFGELYAKNERLKLIRLFSYYETLISVVTVALFSTTCIMIIPFIKLYTQGVDDNNYIAPLFSVILLVSAVLYCLRLPYHNLVIAAGKFKETKMAAYGEAFINIVISIILVIKIKLIGVAIGTLVATSFRFVYYAFFLSKNIINRSLSIVIARMLVNMITFVIIAFGGFAVVSKTNVTSYLQWGFVSLIVFIVSVVITVGANWLIYSEDVESIWKYIVRKVFRS